MRTGINRFSLVPVKENMTFITITTQYREYGEDANNPGVELFIVITYVYVKAHGPVTNAKTKLCKLAHFLCCKAQHQTETD